MHWVGEDSKDYSLIGCTIPGSIFFLSGTNTHISWGTSILDYDTEDTYQLEISSHSDEGTFYYDRYGAEVKIIEAQDEIPVKLMAEGIMAPTCKTDIGKCLTFTLLGNTDYKNTSLISVASGVGKPNSNFILN